MSASDYMENAVLNTLFQKGTPWGALPSPPAMYIALATASIGDADTGSTITEANYTGYSRVLANPADFNAAAGGVIDNLAEILFGKCTAGASTVTHACLVDAVSAGNILWHGAITGGSLAVSVNITPRLIIGALTVTAT